MQPILSEIRRAVLVTAVLAGVCCGAYPLLVFGVGQVLFPREANGSLIKNAEGNIQGSRLIGQYFSSEKYFHARPSAAGKGYDGMSSGGSNLGPTSRKLRDSIARNVARYRASNGVAADVPLPPDAVTASASGLDPHISPENAALQAPRVARSRGIPLETIHDLIRQHTHKPDLKILGEPRVNVLEVNLALDRLPSAMPTN